MKTIRKLITVFAAIIILVYLVGFFLPKSLVVEESIEIKAPIDSVFQQVVQLKSFSIWSPWSGYDPNMQIEFSEEDGKVGSVYKWSGNENVGIGIMEITEIIPNNKVNINLNFIEPYESGGNIFFEFEKEDQKTIVTWGYTEKTPVPKNVMMIVYGSKKMLSGVFNDGLKNLKEVCEN